MKLLILLVALLSVVSVSLTGCGDPPVTRLVLDGGLTSDTAGGGPEVTSPETAGLDGGGFVVPDIGGIGPGDTPQEDTVQGDFLKACAFNGDCDSGFCVPYDLKSDASVCTVFCVDTCPDGFGCKAHARGSDLVFICVPELDPLCLPCAADSDCGFGGDRCLAVEGGHCGRTCTDQRPCPDGFACVDIGGDAEEGATPKQCVPVNGSCTCGALVDFQTDPLNCGECGNVCTYDHAVPVCKTGDCVMATCLDGWVNLNQKLDDGCEYSCADGAAGANDLPDPLGVDSNCDGIDGDLARAVFVAPDGVDEGNTAGTMALPFKTIKAGTSFAAQTQGKDQVLVSKGTYTQQLVVVDGVGVFGAYDRAAGWSRNFDVNITIVRWEAVQAGVVRTLVAKNITSETIIEGLTIDAASNPVPGGSSVAAHILEGSGGLILRKNRIIAGNGGTGLDGQPGQPGQDGDAGSPGIEGVDDKCKPDKTVVGGPGGSNECPGGTSSGGTGGVSGWGGSNSCSVLDTIGCVFSGCDGKTDAGAGGAGLPAALGGAGGTPGPVEEPGQAGGKGTAGPAGSDGEGGANLGALGLNGLWHPTTAGDGAAGGQAGGGGGGGGGGGSDNGQIGDNASHGGSGGGGGAGGCGGTGATGGTGGGASISVLIVGASPTLTDNVIVYRSGGNGGIGGMGGPGGKGGAGAVGGAGWSQSKPGGTGGAGGAGGRGGHGGGGAGGPSVGIMIRGQGSAPSCATNIFSQEGVSGLGGIGGDGSSDIANGEFGLSSAIIGLTPECMP